MMAGALYYLMFFVVCAALMAFAFRPAWQEWRHPSDCKALPISPDYSSDIDYFAQVFHTSVKAAMDGGVSPARSQFNYLPAADTQPDWMKVTKPLIAMGSIDSKLPMQSSKPVFSHGDITSVGGDALTAVMADGAIALGPNSEIREWAHARGALMLGTASVAMRRISSATAIELGDECCFERLHAPVIRFGSDSAGIELERAARQEPVAASYADLPNAVQRTPDMYMIKGDCELPDGRCYQGSLVVTGRLTIGMQTHVIGDIKARRDIVLGARSMVSGAVVCEGQIEVLDDAEVGGPLISEADILLGQAHIGSLEMPTTISAENIIVESGATAHGTVWARDLGVVWKA